VCSPGHFFRGRRRCKPARVRHRSFPARRPPNANILAAAAASKICRHSNGIGSISGISGALSYTSVATGTVSLGATEALFNLLFLYTPRGAKNILSESHLLANFGIKVDELPPRVIFADGSSVPALRVNGLFYVDLRFVLPKALRLVCGGGVHPLRTPAATRRHACTAAARRGPSCAGPLAGA